MRRFVLVLGLAVGCTWLGEVDTPPAPGVALGEPWASMSLPIDGATVRYTRDDTFTAYVPKAAVADLATTWDTAFKAKGYALDADLSGETIVSRTYVQGAASLAVSIQAEDDGAVVSVTRLGGTP